MISRKGFTIVELLIVIVVIAILATITIVAYNGVQSRAKVAAIQSDLTNAAKKIELYRTINNDSYPTSLADASVTSGANTTLQYSVSNGIDKDFCITATNGTQTYYVGAQRSPGEGTCYDNYGIVGQWSLNNLNDQSGNAYTLSAFNSPTQIVGQNGTANGAYQFSGTNQYFSAPGATSKLVGRNAMTISGWVNPATTSTGHRTYFGFRTGTSSLYILQFTNSTNLECRLQIGGTYFDAGLVSITPNTWQLLTLVYDGRDLTCHKNGISGTSTTTLGAPIPSSELFYIGGAPSNYHAGSIDDVRLYSRALGQQEIQGIFAAGAK